MEDIIQTLGAMFPTDWEYRSRSLGMMFPKAGNDVPERSNHSLPV